MLSKALAHDPDIQDAYFDGILWVELGDGSRVLALISDLVALIKARRVMTTIEAARTAPRRWATGASSWSSTTSGSAATSTRFCTAQARRGS
jgi:hypothetical protein